MEKLFKFPIVMIDGINEEKKSKLSLPTEDDPDIIIGYAECPHDDFLSVSDRWMPDDNSFQNALNGKFNACEVVFGQCGSYIVPWNREKFKDKLNEFRKSLPAEHIVLSARVLPKEEIEIQLLGPDKSTSSE